MNEKENHTENASQEQELNASYADVQKALSKHVWQHEDLRAEIVKNPKAVIERELGIKFPEDLEVTVIDQETSNAVCFNLPPNPSKAFNAELSDKQLDAIAGGLSFTDLTDMAKNVFNFAEDALSGGVSIAKDIIGTGVEVAGGISKSAKNFVGKLFS